MIFDAWPGLTLLNPVPDGHRSTVSVGIYDGQRVAVRRSRRSADSLRWELDLLASIADLGLHIAEIVPTINGEPHANGVVVQRWIDGRQPAAKREWQLVAEQLRRLHEATADRDQRPNCCIVTELRQHQRSVDADISLLPDAERELILEIFDRFVDTPIAVIHGDPGASNIRIDDEDRVWLLDWDESRVDLCWLDLANLGLHVLDDDTHHQATILAHAWEAINAWTAEPTYARRRLAELEHILNSPRA